MLIHMCIQLYIYYMILEAQELFPKAYFTHKPIYAYLSLFTSSWNMQEHWGLDLFCLLGDGRIYGVFATFCVLYKSTRYVGSVFKMWNVVLK